MIDPKSYALEIRTLDEGDGWLATFPDLPGCMGDGATPEMAIADGYEAATAWLSVAQTFGDPIPKPGNVGRVRPRCDPHAQKPATRLVVRADQEGVSMNTLVVSLIAEGVGARIHG
jgi:antitoxin HicB